MEGTVKAVNPLNGMFAVEVDDGGFTIVELLDSVDVGIGEVVHGELQSLGGESLLNVTTGDKFDCYIQNFDVPPSSIRQQLLLG